MWSAHLQHLFQINVCEYIKVFKCIPHLSTLLLIMYQKKELSSLRLLNVFVINIFIVMQYDLLVNTCTFERNLFVLQRQSVGNNQKIWDLKFFSWSKVAWGISIPLTYNAKIFFVCFFRRMIHVSFTVKVEILSRAERRAEGLL